MPRDRPGRRPRRARNAIRVRWTVEKSDRYRHLELPDDLFDALVATLPPREDRDHVPPPFSSSHACLRSIRGYLRRGGLNGNREVDGMRLVRLLLWVMTWAALGYLWKERSAYRERLPAAQVIAASSPPFALPPP